jgi:addiction module HigA family antidote
VLAMIFSTSILSFLDLLLTFSNGITVTQAKWKYLIIIRKNMEKLANIHPGEVLKFEFLEPLKISAYRLSKDLNIPQTRISEIIKGKRRITADTALRLSKYFGNSAKCWLGLQDDYDIEEERITKQAELDNIKQHDSKNVA